MVSALLSTRVWQTLEGRQPAFIWFGSRRLKNGRSTDRIGSDKLGSTGQVTGLDSSFQTALI